MNQFEICLNTSVNGIPFGSERAAVRAALGSKFEEFKRVNSVKTPQMILEAVTYFILLMIVLMPLKSFPR